MSQALHLANGATINEKLRSDTGAVAREAAAGRADAEMIDRPLPRRPRAAADGRPNASARGTAPEGEPAGLEPSPRPGPRRGGRRSKTCTGRAHQQGIPVQSLKFNSTRSDDSAGPGSEATAGVGCSTSRGNVHGRSHKFAPDRGDGGERGFDLRLRLAADPPAGPSFRADVAPILVRKCLGCHNDKKAEGGLNMATFDAVSRGGTAAGDLIIEPGDPDSSFLIDSVRGGAARPMPLQAARLKAQEIATLARWVEQGAKFDGPSPETTIASLVDPLAGLPEVPVKARRPRRSAPWPFASLGEAPGGRLGARVVFFDVAAEQARGRTRRTIRARSRPWPSRPAARC